MAMVRVLTVNTAFPPNLPDSSLEGVFAIINDPFASKGSHKFHKVDKNKLKEFAASLSKQNVVADKKWDHNLDDKFNTFATSSTSNETELDDLDYSNVSSCLQSVRMCSYCSKIAKVHQILKKCSACKKKQYCDKCGCAFIFFHLS